MTTNHKKYHSKLLLFGEYTVTLGSGALAIPYEKYSGCWDFGNGHEQSKQGLRKLAEYVGQNHELAVKYNLTAFYEALDRGLYFASDIPSGYGLGSSGAVVAAFYETYSLLRSDVLALLKHELSLLECAFHGASSGIDPLVSLINLVVHISDQNEIFTSVMDKKDYRMFLMDTGITRKTGPLVSLFKNKLNADIKFKDAVQQLTKINRAAISSYIADDRIALFGQFDSISKIQYDFFGEMIPDHFREIWKTGLDSNKFRIKLCGAGGGGVLMGIMKDHIWFPDELTGFRTSFI